MACPVCRAPEAALFASTHDRRSPEEPPVLFDLCRCLGACGALYTVYPDGWDLHRIYEDGDAYHVGRQGLVGHPAYEEVERFASDRRVAESRLAWVARYGDPEEIARRHGGPTHRPWLIDVGCSNGALVLAATEHGYRARGCDISPYIIRKAVMLTGLELPHFFTKNVDDAPFEDADWYHVVQCNDVIEHSADPTLFLSRLGKLAAPGGLLFVDTPDFDDPEFSRLGVSYRHVRPVEHAVMLHERALRWMAEAADLETIDVYRPIPGKCVLVARRRP